MLRIGILCHSAIGGSSRVGVELGAQLAARGHDVHLFARSAPLASAMDGPRFTPCLLDPGAPLSSRLDRGWSNRDVNALVERIATVVDQHGLDILHYHYAIPFARVASKVRRRLGSRAPRIVGTLHGTDISPPTSGPDSRNRLQRALRAADALTTVSRSHAALAQSSLALPRPVHVIPNFVDANRFRPRFRAASDGATAPRILHVSNFRRVKDPQRMARAFCEVRRRREATLWIVGDGEEMPAVRKILASADVESDVRYLGLRLDVEAVYGEADVLLLTSRSESFCLAALEAAACGVPAVAPRVGGLAEVVADGVSGLLYDGADAREPAAAILRLLGDPETHARMSGAAVEVARRFRPPAIVARYEDLYGALIGSVTTSTELPIASVAAAE